MRTHAPILVISGSSWQRPWGPLNKERAAANGPATAAIPAAPSTRRSIRSTRATSRSCASRGGGRRSTRASARESPNFSHSNNFRATPLMIGGVLYSPNGIGLVEAFHPGTGKTLWVQEPFPDEPGQGLRGDSARGVAYWSDGNERRLFVVRGEYLDRARPAHGQTGCRRSATGGRVNLRPGLGPRATVYAWTGAPQVCRDVVIVGVGLGGGMTDAPHAQGGSRRETSRRSTCAPASRAGRSIRFRRPAKSATRRGRTTRGRTAARRTCGR